MIILVDEEAPVVASSQLFSSVQLSPCPPSPGPTSSPDTAYHSDSVDVDLSLSQLVADLTIPPAEPVATPRRYAFLDANNESGQVINFSDGPLSHRHSVALDGFNHADDDPIIYPPPADQIIPRTENAFNGATYPTFFD